MLDSEAGVFFKGISIRMNENPTPDPIDYGGDLVGGWGGESNREIVSFRVVRACVRAVLYVRSDPAKKESLRPFPFPFWYRRLFPFPCRQIR